MNVLVIDVGGTNLKFQATGQTEVHKLSSGPAMTAERMAAEIIEATRDWALVRLARPACTKGVLPIRVLPVDMEHYLGHLQERTRHLPDDLSDLARDHVTFLQRLARNRTLLERRFYLVVPAQVEPHGTRRRWPFSHTQPMENLDGIRRQLTFRCEEIERQLGRCGLTARRLGNPELVHLFYACWCPDLARVQRLQPDLGHSITPVIASSIRKQRNLP